MPRFSKLSPSGSSNKSVCAFLTYFTGVTYFANSILQFIIQMILGMEYKLQSCMSWSFHSNRIKWNLHGQMAISNCKNIPKLQGPVHAIYMFTYMAVIICNAQLHWLHTRFIFLFSSYVKSCLCSSLYRRFYRTVPVYAGLTKHSCTKLWVSHKPKLWYPGVTSHSLMLL